jgi:hypothetical protein
MGGLRFLTSYYSQNNGFQLDIVGECLLHFESRLLCGPVKADLEQASWPSLEKVMLISLMIYFHVDDYP